MVAVPTHAPADVQRDLREEQQHRGNLVADALGRMEVPGVEREEFLPRQGIAEIELMRADDVAFRADAKQLGLDGIHIQLRVNRAGEHGVERLGQPLARSPPVRRRVLHAVRNPQIGQAALTDGLADARADLAAADAMLDPERRGPPGPDATA